MFASDITGCSNRITGVDGCQPRDRQKCKNEKAKRSLRPQNNMRTEWSRLVTLIPGLTIDRFLNIVFRSVFVHHAFII